MRIPITRDEAAPFIPRASVCVIESISEEDWSTKSMYSMVRALIIIDRLLGRLTDEGCEKHRGEWRRPRVVELSSTPCMQRIHPPGRCFLQQGGKS